MQELDGRRPGLARAHFILAVATMALILVQPILAGQFISDPDEDTLVDAHGGLANLIFLMAIGQLVLSFLARSELSMAVIGHNVLLVVLVTAQIGLGYSGDYGDQAFAIHIPLGVLLFGLSISLVTLSLSGRRRAFLPDRPST